MKFPEIDLQFAVNELVRAIRYLSYTGGSRDKAKNSIDAAKEHIEKAVAGMAADNNGD